MGRSFTIAVAFSVLGTVAGTVLTSDRIRNALRSRIYGGDQPNRRVLDLELKNDSTLCILAIGQSNAACHGWPPARAGAKAFAIDDGQFFRLTDPVPGASGSGGSVWTRLAPRLLRHQDCEAVVVGVAAQGSSTAESWAPEGSHHPRLVRAVNSFRDQDLVIDLVVWHQGETESWQDDASGLAYGPSLQAVVTSLRELEVEADVFVCRATRDGLGTTNAAIRHAQSSVWDAGKSVYAGVDTDSLTDEFRSDGVHFNERGLEEFARLLEKAINQRSDDQPTRFKD